MSSTLLARLAALKISLAPAFNCGSIRNGSQWFIGREGEVAGKLVQWAAFGDFARNLSEKWTNSENLSAQEQEQVHAFIKDAQAKIRKEREDHWAQVQVEVEKEWALFSDLGTTPYLERKDISGLWGCRVEAHDRGARLIVPARDVEGRIWGYQRIYSEKLSISGTDKIFREGARKEGCFHLLGGELKGASCIYLCEGISTAIAISGAIPGVPVVSCFDAGNLGYVAKALRGIYHGAHFCFCADNDCWPAKDGKIYHTGRVKAERAAAENGPGHVVLPVFPRELFQERPTDFDDVRRLLGVEAVKQQILNAPKALETDEPTALRGLDARNAKGEPIKPGERSVAMALLRYYEDHIMVQDQDVFLYMDGYWQWQSRDGIKQIKRELAILYGAKAGIRDIENAYRYFLTHAPTPPRDVNLFVPQYWCANFRNGTLHFMKQSGGVPKLEFRQHCKPDFCTAQLPFDFPGLDRLETPPGEFEKMLERIWEKDADFPAKRRVLSQLFGAAIMPAYTKIFFLVGKRGSGKSTVIKLVNRLIDPKNVSRVDPSYFHGFHMETMVGKLVNMDPDINLHKPIQDDIIKKIIDRVPFRVSRKFQTDLMAPLPPIHLFGGNDLPQSMEGATGAYSRRVIILNFGAYSAEDEEQKGNGYELDFDEWLWHEAQNEIISFAIKGLVDLVSCKGHFTVPNSSKESLKEWDSRSDMLGDFLEALELGEVDKGNQYFLDPKGIITRKLLWERFASWQRESGYTCALWDQRKFASALRRGGFKDKKSDGVRYWVGIGVKPSGESAV
jgi:phage/plasmid primase-like uncharacterized protein/phage/plasmid-associated DNA primase